MLKKSNENKTSKKWYWSNKFWKVNSADSKRKWSEINKILEKNNGLNKKLRVSTKHTQKPELLKEERCNLNKKITQKHSRLWGKQIRTREPVKDLKIGILNHHTSRWLSSELQSITLQKSSPVQVKASSPGKQVQFWKIVARTWSQMKWKRR